MRIDRLVMTTLIAAGLVAAVSSCARPAGTAAGLSGVASTPASPAPISAPASVSPSAAAGVVRDTAQINGVLVAAGGRNLSIDYVGGACDVSASARADETSTTVTVHVLVKDSGGVCPAVGYARTANAVLASPWNGRHIVDITGATVATMDAAQLLQPTWLPPGYLSAGIAQVGGSDGNVDAYETWAVPSSVPSPGATTCKPTQDALSVTQGVLGPQPPGYPTVPGTYAVKGQPATLQRANDPFNTGDLTLTWTPPGRPSGWTATVSSNTQCQGDTPLTADTVLRFANGLH